jgi:5-methylcytosine-specific restriction endonuclease McrA
MARGVTDLLAALRESEKRDTRTTVRRGQAAEKARLLLETAGACEGCNVLMPDPDMMHVHHVTPVSRGGSNAPDNVVLLCPNCHAVAHWFDRTMPEAERPTDRVSLFRRMGEWIPGYERIHYGQKAG